MKTLAQEDGNRGEPDDERRVGFGEVRAVDLVACDEALGFDEVGGLVVPEGRVKEMKEERTCNEYGGRQDDEDASDGKERGESFCGHLGVLA
ncbi:hypothetical protein [Tunturiibacter gelidiferens]|uniref:hypothetical protein n=1 Tax=Tunturiibacter gelidiferens TaxID=3069689 RepID=UPI003D9B5B42